MTSTSLRATDRPERPARASAGRITLLVFVIVAAVTIFPISAALPAAAYGVPVAITLLLAMVQAGAMVLVLIRPVLASALAVIGVLAFALVTPPGGPWPVMVTSMLAMTAVIMLASRAQWPVGLCAGVVAVLGSEAIALWGPVARQTGAAIADLIVFASLCAVALLLGLLWGKWAAARAQLARERAATAAELARREAVEERTRLARELHDVVAHGMSAIQVQASSARYRLPALSAEAVDEFDSIAALARQSMSEMRSLLAVLRSEETEGESVPQPTVAQVPQLVAAAERSGSRIELDDRLSSAQAAAFDPVLSLTIYRIVQESLSNVARHATGADTLITLEQRDGAVNLEVRNAAALTTTAPRMVPDAGGHGIRGMRERVALHHGTLEAVPTVDGGFVVRAVIPLAQAVSKRDSDLDSDQKDTA